MQKNLGGSFVNSEGNLIIKGDNTPGLQGGDWERSFSNPISGDKNPRDGNFRDFVLIAGASAATPMMQQDRTVTDQTVSMSANQSTGGNFSKSNGTITNAFSIPSSSTNAAVAVMTNDGGVYPNNFIVSSAGKDLVTIKNSGSASVSVAGGSTLTVTTTGIPKFGLDVYNISINVTTTKTVTVTTMDPSKLKP